MVQWLVRFTGARGSSRHLVDVGSLWNHQLAGYYGDMANYKGVQSRGLLFGMIGIHVETTRQANATHLCRFSRFGGAVPEKDMQVLAKRVVYYICASGCKTKCTPRCVSALKAFTTIGRLSQLQTDTL